MVGGGEEDAHWPCLVQQAKMHIAAFQGNVKTMMEGFVSNMVLLEKWLFLLVCS